MTTPTPSPLNPQGTPIASGEVPNPMFGRWLAYINALAAFIQGLFATGGSFATVPDSLGKAWVRVTGSTGAILSSLNVSGVVRNSAGNYTVTFATPFASADSYVAVVTCNNWVCSYGARTASTIVIFTFVSNTAAAIDENFDLLVFGR